MFFDNSSEEKNNQLQNKILQEFGEDSIYLTGTSIPPGKFTDLFQRSYKLWLKGSTELSNGNGYTHPQLDLWQKTVFLPLFQQSLKSSCPVDVALSYAYLGTLRFTFGFIAGSCPKNHPKIMPLSKQLESHLKSLLANDLTKTIITILQALDREGLTNWTESTKGKIDYIGSESLQIALLTVWLNQELTFEEVVLLAEISLPNGSHGRSVQPSLAPVVLALVIKAQETLDLSTTDQKKALITALSKFNTQYNTSFARNELNEFEQEATPLNLRKQLIALEARLLAKYSLFRSLYLSMEKHDSTQENSLSQSFQP